jgi:hypothetical protein
VDGAVIAWSVAQGRRGRRWRAMVVRGESVAEAVLLEVVLLEVDPDGRIARLELTTPAGMLTLHPEPDQREIHGNVVAPDGSVRPLAFAWSPDHEIDVGGRPIALAVALHRRRAVVAVGARAAIPVLAIDPSLGVQMDVRRVVRLDADRWSVDDASGAPAREIVVDAQGLPAAEATWPLED